MATKPRITIKRLPNGRDADGIIMHYGTACIVISTDSEATYTVWENLLELEHPGWKCELNHKVKNLLPLKVLRILWAFTAQIDCIGA